jgi:hypothetical protein
MKQVSNALFKTQITAALADGGEDSWGLAGAHTFDE